MLENNDYQNENLINNESNINKQIKISIKKKSSDIESINNAENNENQNHNPHLNFNYDNNLEENQNNNQNTDSNNKEKKRSSIGNEIIEDNIKKTDTLHFQNGKKKKGDNVNLYFEGDKDLISITENKKTNNKTKNNLIYHLKVNKTFLKYSTLITIIFYILLTIASCTKFTLDQKNRFLFCFEFLERIPSQSQDKAKLDVIYFLTDLNSFYIIHAILFISFISVCYLLIKGKKSKIEAFFKDMSIFLSLTLIFNVPIFFLGIFNKDFYGSFARPITYLVLSFLGLLSMFKIFIVAKRHKYKDIPSIINISILSSFMMAYQCYCFIFNLTYFYMNFSKPKMDEKDNEARNSAIEIIDGCAYFAIGIIVMTIFKDIFFAIAMVIIENGLLYTKRIDPYFLTTALFNISILSLNFASIIIIIFAYNKKVFRLKERK